MINIHSASLFLSFDFLSYFASIRTMSWTCSGKTNLDMVEKLKSSSIIKSEKVYNVMKQVDRGNYIASSPYMDSPQSIGYGATISAPHMHAFALEYLESNLKEGMKVLDVGSGSGYLTSCLALMVGSSGKAIGIDHIDDLVEMGRKNIQKDQPELLSSERITLVVGDGRKGYAPGGPYNAINVGAAAVELHQELVDQLAPGGRLVLPIGPDGDDQHMEQIDKKADGSIERQVLMGVRFVSLASKEKQLGGRRNKILTNVIRKYLTKVDKNKNG
ncbi:protein-L-isoaspartate(D-aspartate) O-methyltransferase [Lepeophtheirus salmonis]|nr:protein-L-isoaspartate(D-aspartate) O-methyltransferase-like [Lepeophtheirus salmonis]